MAEVSKASDSAAAAGGEQLAIYANQITIDTPREGLFSLEQWAVIAGTGMALSLLMIVVVLVMSWRRERRRKRARR